MDSNAFVCTTYIKATPEQLWQGLTDPAFTRRYWGVEFVTDWTAGSAMVWRERDTETADPGQVVREADPYRRLSYTWHTFTPGWAKANGIDDGTLAELAAEQRSKVTFEIEDLGGTVKLTVVHDGFEPGSTARKMIQHGWPALVSGLKTLLETGDTLPEPA
ncbi:SRPBCC family protein [Streptomyces sp. AC627_RSS907]|uniref:SRPBCC family protein n=1 Tax=Streptomyces sp. AC627_RSS907 TaxID=2823684 RepID=UPI0020B7A3FF|nr:SRPBCC family protein [Streptomyces sp. AC627_RSS907]